jgi:membrane protease YdiL (CAAX protease family)
VITLSTLGTPSTPNFLTTNAYFSFKKAWYISPWLQVSLLLAAFIFIAVLGKFCLLKTGLLFGKPNSFYLETLFAPIYEEIIFRGIVLGALLKHFSVLKAIIFTSLLFGIWHLKNIFFVEPAEVLRQICYAGFVFGPVLAWATYRTQTIWIASVIHYINNGVLFLIYYLACKSA